jgi:hypothetical protein
MGQRHFKARSERERRHSRRQEAPYILDSIRHPAEVELLRHVYQNAY